MKRFANMLSVPKKFPILYSIFLQIKPGSANISDSRQIICSIFKENVYSAPEHIPFTTEPSLLSLETFQKIKSVQPIINRLIHRASQEKLDII